MEECVPRSGLSGAGAAGTTGLDCGAGAATEAADLGAGVCLATGGAALAVRVDATLSLTIQLQADMYRKLEAKAARSGQTAGDLIAQAITALVEE